MVDVVTTDDADVLGSKSQGRQRGRVTQNIWSGDANAKSPHIFKMLSRIHPKRHFKRKKITLGPSPIVPHPNPGSVSASPRITAVFTPIQTWCLHIRQNDSFGPQRPYTVTFLAFKNGPSSGQRKCRGGQRLDEGM